MFNIGMGELVMLLLVAFIIVGPKDLPKVAVALAKGIKYVKRMVRDVMSSLNLNEAISEFNDVRKEVEEVVNLENIVAPVKKELDEVTSVVGAVEEDLKGEVTQINNELSKKI